MFKIELPCPRWVGWAAGLYAKPVLVGQPLTPRTITSRCIGIEPSRIPVGKAPLTGEAAQDAAHPIADPDLEILIRAWPRLPEPIKAGIQALVRAAGV